jgi:hypothetical protein
VTHTRPWPLISPSDAVLVNHVSDTHWGYRDWSDEEGDTMLQDYAEGLVPVVDLFLHTGDIVDHGLSTEDDYAVPWLTTAGCPAGASLWVMGNHDIRGRSTHTRQAWETAYGRDANTYVDVKGIRFLTITVDDFSLEDSQWTVPPESWEWAADMATEHDGPVVFCDHYPPMEFGGLLTQDALLPQASLNDLFEDCPNIVGMMCGHLHRNLDDPTLASFVTLGGRTVPLLTDISSMLSLEGEPGRDESAKIQSTSAYVEILPDTWRVRYRRHGSHAWGGPDDQRVTTMDLTGYTVTRGM